MNDKIACMICGKLFAMITNTHLKSHQITTLDYKKQFPDASLMSVDQLDSAKKYSSTANEKRKGVKRTESELEAIRAGIKAKGPRISANKGKPMPQSIRDKLSEVAKRDIASGKRVVNRYEMTDEIREKISKTLTGRKIGPERITKAIATRRDRGDDLAFFRGRTHSDVSKALISAKSTESAQRKRPILRQYMLERIDECNLNLLNSISDDVFELECRICQHRFTRTPQVFHNCRFHTEICDQCFPISPVSLQEIEVREWIRANYTGGMLHSDMEIITPLELDIVLPELKLAIEYCGIYWHSEKAGKPHWYHRKKHDLCSDRGYRLITIFEDEWKNKPELVKSMLGNAIGVNTRTISARKCHVEVINSKLANQFIQNNHIQGRGRANIYYGLFHLGELISVMSFSDNEISRRSQGWDINRFCSLLGTNVRGGAGKLFKQFVRDHNPSQVVSYADLRWGSGRVYGHLGFEHIGNTVPNYWYFRDGEMRRYHRYGLRKNKTDDPTRTEWENRQLQGWNRIWDCGHAKWVWTVTRPV